VKNIDGFSDQRLISGFGAEQNYALMFNRVLMLNLTTTLIDDVFNVKMSKRFGSWT
jgi:hypothetical protein